MATNTYLMKLEPEPWQQPQPGSQRELDVHSPSRFYSIGDYAGQFVNALVL